MADLGRRGGGAEIWGSCLGVAQRASAKGWRQGSVNSVKRSWVSFWGSADTRARTDRCCLCLRLSEEAIGLSGVLLSIFIFFLVSNQLPTKYSSIARPRKINFSFLIVFLKTSFIYSTTKNNHDYVFF